MRRGFRWGLLAIGIAAGAFACGEDGVEQTPGEDGGTQPLPGTDGGTEFDGGTDGEGPVIDPPPAPTDGGTPSDGGTFNAGPPIPTPTLPNWQFFGRGQGGPTQVLGVSADQGGNIWVAGGNDGLFLLTPGATTFRRFTIADGLTPVKHPTQGDLQQKVTAVAGGKAGEVFVGYEGFNDVGGLGYIEAVKEEDLHKPQNLWATKSGDVDIVSINGPGIAVKHLDIYSPAGTFNEFGVPANFDREKIFTIERIVYSPAKGDAFFGGVHGVAAWDGVAKKVQEHVHADINIFKKETDSNVTFASDDWFGIGLDAKGDLWIGDAYRTGRVAWSTQRYLEGGVKPPRPFVDIWPDAVQANAKPSQRTDDNIREFAMNPDGSFWAAGLGRGLALVVPNADATPASITRIGPEAFFSGATFRSLERDPANGSLWVGHQAGLTRRSPSGEVHNFINEFHASNPASDALLNIDTPDIQSDVFNGQRRILVAFQAGAIGIYTGP